MKFSLKWLRRYIDLTVSVPEMLDRLTLSGTEVEGSSTTGVDDVNVVVGHILSSVQHPNADRLRICRVADGMGERSVVCGARNYKDGDKVPLALPGAKLPGGVLIKESKLRGELSQGMLCSAKELALAEDAEGLLLLPPDAPVGTRFSEYMPGDTFFEVEVTSNRPDLLSYYGLARELAAAGAGVLKARPIPTMEYPEAPECPVSVTLEAPDLCALYSLVYLTGAKVAESPVWLKDAILATGHKPINNVVDITNFVLFELGQPLHAFCSSKLAGNTIHIRRANAGEELLALDDLSYKLTPENLVIADASGAIAVAGVKGGKPTGISDGTSDILLETAWFLPSTIRRTSRQLGLSSDSSYRYERRVDAGSLLAARDRAVQLLQEITGAKVAAKPLTVGSVPALRSPVRLRYQKLDGLLGLSISKETISKQLTSLGCTEIEADANSSIWQPPSWRDDLAREVDLIEEVARLTGMEAIPSRVRASGQPESSADVHHYRIAQLRRFLAGQGWDECVTDPLQTKDAAEAQISDTSTAIRLVNPLNELYTHLRPGLQSSLLQVAGRSIAKGAPGCRLFEVGKVYLKTAAGETDERLRLGLLVTGTIQTGTWYQPERGADLYDLTGILQALERSAGLAKAAIVKGGTAPMAPAERVPFDLKTATFYVELDLKEWLANAPQPGLYRPLSPFPAMRRDIAIVVPNSLAHGDIEAVISKAIPPAIFEEIVLFDVFRDEKGEKIPADQKSLAYSMTFRSAERTLTEKEVNTAFEAVKQSLVTQLKCTLREGK